METACRAAARISEIGYPEVVSVPEIGYQDPENAATTSQITAQIAWTSVCSAVNNVPKIAKRIGRILVIAETKSETGGETAGGM